MSPADGEVRGDAYVQLKTKLKKLGLKWKGEKFQCPRSIVGIHSADFTVTFDAERGVVACSICGAGGLEVIDTWARDRTQYFTDLGNARRLVTQHGKDFRYCREIGWFVWNGRFWEPDETGEVLRRAKSIPLLLMKEAKALVQKEAAEATEDDKDKPRKSAAVGAWARKSESIGRLKAAVELARTELGVAIEVRALDADPWKLTVENGTLDLHTGKLLPHDRDDLTTKHAAVAYDPEAKCPLWETFLTKVLSGDKELISYVQRAAGYTLTGVAKEHVLFFCHGAGKNGKSTFLNILSRLLGRFSAMTPTRTLMAKKELGIPNDVARLRGARLVRVSETGENKRIDEELVKQFTSEDPIAARFLNHEFFEFVPTFKVWISGNHKPVITGTDEGIWRRIRLIPFNVVISAEECDTDLESKLAAELPGILSWAVRGTLEWQKKGLGAARAVSSATEHYRDESNLVTEFLDEECIAAGCVGRQDLYSAYKSWCAERSEFVIKFKNFNQRLVQLGLNPDFLHDNERVWSPLKLKTPEHFGLPAHKI